MVSPTTALARQLVRMWRTVPLLELKQGSSLSIRSNLPWTTKVCIQPEWRDDGLVELEHFFPHRDNDNEQAVEMTIRREDLKKTSLGRVEPHVSLNLQPSTFTSLSDSPSQQGGGSSSVLRHSKAQPTEKIMLDDGSVLPADSEEIVAISQRDGVRTVEYSDGVAHLSNVKASVVFPGIEANETILNVKVPEKLNITCELNRGGGSISISDKVEGDITLFTKDGDIDVSKLRGHSIDLSSTGSVSIIRVAKLVEAEKVSINTPGRVRAKQVHGQRVNISVHQKDDIDAEAIVVAGDDEDDEGSLVDVSALFVSGSGGATIDVKSCRPLRRRAVRVKSHHGPLEVLTTIGVDDVMPSEANELTKERYPVVELGGVNGNCELSIKGTESSPANIDQDWSSCVVHFDSISLGSVSLLSVDRGNATITMDRKVESDIRLLSLPSSESLAEAGSLLAEEENPDLVVDVLNHLSRVEGGSRTNKISIETTSFTSRPQSVNTGGVEYVDGWIENKSEEPDSRFELKSGVGKIRLDGAAEQALQSFSGSGEKNSAGIDADHERPLVAAVVSSGRITLESVSWIGAIARRYGLDENGTDRELGRTASRKGRPIVASSVSPTKEYK